MAFFDDMNKKLSKMGQSALEKTKNVSETVRVSGAMREEEEKQAQWYKQLGEYFYENYADQADGEVKVLCSNILASKVQVMQYKEQLQVLKGTIQCPNCGAEIAENSSFCSICGSKIERTRMTMLSQSTTGIVCRNCGEPMSEGQRFCVKCGTEMKEEKPDESGAECTPEREEKTCPKCGHPLAEGAAFCVQCGYKVE